MENDSNTALLEEIEQNTKTASDIAGDRAMNDRYFRTLMDAPDGKLEKQAKPGGLYIRRRMRERSVGAKEIVLEIFIAGGPLPGLPDEPARRTGRRRSSAREISATTSNALASAEPAGGRAQRRVRRAKQRRGWDSNPRDPCGPAGFQDRCLQPLGHPSV